MGNARVCKKARRGHSPNPKVPRVEIELVPQLLSILSLANVSVSMLNPIKCLLLKAGDGVTCLSVSWWQRGAVVTQIAAVPFLFRVGIHVERHDES